MKGWGDEGRLKDTMGNVGREIKKASNDLRKKRRRALTPVKNKRKRNLFDLEKPSCCNLEQRVV